MVSQKAPGAHTAASWPTSWSRGGRTVRPLALKLTLAPILGTNLDPESCEIEDIVFYIIFCSGEVREASIARKSSVEVTKPTQIWRTSSDEVREAS